MSVLTKGSGNFNISAYRVLYILLLLTRYRSLNVMELNRFLADNPWIQRGYNGETVTKYMNTLRYLGCRIPRSSIRTDYCYELLANPFPMPLPEEEWRIALRLLSDLAERQDDQLYARFHGILQKALWAAGYAEPEIAGLLPARLPQYDNEVRQEQESRIRQYRAYCEEAFLLEISYPAGGMAKTVMLEPHAVLEKGGRFLLLGVELGSLEKRMLDLAHITGVRQLPAKVKRSLPEVTVRFELTDRLARTYRPYPGEQIVYRTANCIQVRTRVVEVSALTSRLLKYGPHCRVISPAFVRQTMREQIDRMLGTPNTG